MAHEFKNPHSPAKKNLSTIGEINPFQIFISRVQIFISRDWAIWLPYEMPKNSQTSLSTGEKMDLHSSTDWGQSNVYVMFMHINNKIW